jgi:hypothetical protein
LSIITGHNPSCLFRRELLLTLPSRSAEDMPDTAVGREMQPDLVTLF